MSSDPSSAYAAHGGLGLAAGAPSVSSTPPPTSQSASRESHDYHSLLSIATLSPPKSSHTSSSNVDSRSERRCRSPSPTAVSTASTGTISSGAVSGHERGRPLSSPSPSPSPTPLSSGGGDTLQLQLQQQQHAVVLSPVLTPTTNPLASSSPLLTGSGHSTSTSTSSVGTYPGTDDDASRATHVEAGSNPRSSVSSSGSGTGINTAVPAPTNPLYAGPSASLVGAHSSLANASVSPSSPSVSPTNASATNPRRSLNAAFTISPRTDSEVEAFEEYNSDEPSVCLELDRHDPPIKQYCNLGSLEERRTFVTEGCVKAAKSMSTQRIIDHLLPAILTAFEADDYGESFDTCAPSIARALPHVIACIEHKTTANLTYFMGLIMELCCSAEQAVVKETIASLRKILGMVEDEVVLKLFLPFVLTMRLSFWSAPRMIAASLLGHIAARPAVLQASGLTVTDLFNYYAESSTDASAMVRVGVVTSLHDWIKVASVHRLSLAEMPLPLLRSLATDDLSDTVRYLLIEEIVKLARLIGRKATSKYLLSTYVSGFVDPSWRVRFTAASHIGAMSALVLNADDLDIVLKTLAADEEPETRAAVARQLDTVVQHCSSTVIEHCCALVVEHFAEDENPVVRRSAARHCHCFIYGSDEVVRSMCDSLAKLMEDTSFVVQESAIKSLGDLITSLDKSVRAAEQQAALSDSVHNNSTASGNGTSAAGTRVSSSTSSRSSTSKAPQSAPPRLPIHSRSGRRHSPHRASRFMMAATGSNGSTSTAEANVIFMKKRADSIARAFVEKLTLLSGSRNWRIRDVVVRVTQYFPKVLPPDEFSPLTSIVFGALHDPVSAIRTQAVYTLKKVAIAYGGAWAARTATELLHSDIFSPTRTLSYMWRVVMIQCLEVLLPVVSELEAKAVLRQQLLVVTVALMKQYTTDRVPNVRIAVALALPKWFAWFDVSESERAAYNEAIRTLQQDTDADVLDASQHIPYNTRADAEA
ncbi:putative protein phosphatase 2A regulatory subunit [Leptomonas seymouri]|uniref:Protein phosphatase 2A regulatory subunit n=1 Tax=Leptomonas seymouri TaxID=5684 RepID=A0A0N1PA72_LEPSE|nr:putative protein phosphatase 2A regulatory subunit [Leptomonas seymouri]|eukprot:KPI83735.1 putative protein phosphatase 2A regulatory subunit [Leptomonas seymouri]